jgi:hypothetical protein
VDRVEVERKSEGAGSPGQGSATHARLRTGIDAAACALTIPSCLYVMIRTVRFVVEHALRVPMWDQWQEMMPERDVAHLAAQHNEHRILVARLLFALDDLHFGGRGFFCLFSILASLVVTALLVAAAAARGGANRMVGVVAVSTSATLLLSSYSWENLLWSFQVSFVAVLPAAVAAFLVFSRASSGRRSLAAALFCAAVATYSLASGILVAPLLVIFALIQRRPTRQVVVLVVFTIAVVALYFHGYETPNQHASPSASIRDPALLARYLSAYLGAPFSWRFDEQRVGAAQAIGAFGLAAWVAVLASSIRRLPARDAAYWVLPLSMTFSVGAGFLTALGRVNFPIEQAFASRYGSPVLLFWSALFAHLLRSTTGAASHAAASALAGAASLALASEQHHHEAIGGNRMDRLRSGETVLLSGALDTDVVDKLSPAPYLITNVLPELRLRHLSVFSEPWASWLGDKLSRHVDDYDDSACVGFLDAAHPVPAYGDPAFRVEGWAYSRVDGTAAARIALIDENGSVVGFAQSGYLRPDVRAEHPEIADESTGFIGYVGRVTRDRFEVRAVALLRDGRLGCELGRRLTLNAAEAASLVRK